MPEAPPYIQSVHSIPGRTRLRCSWLRREPGEARRLADELSRTPGVHEVRVRPRTGSVLVHHEPALEIQSIIDTVSRITGVGHVVPRGEAPPVARPETAPGSAIGDEAMKLFRELDRDVARLSDGHMDLPTLVAGTFLGLGAIEVVVTGNLPVPPWFNLAWWSFRVLSTVEREALKTRDGVVSKAALH